MRTEEELARGKRLRTLREGLDLTRLEFAASMDVSEHTLKSLENGARKLTAPAVREYCRRFILAGIDVSFDFLYHGNDLQRLDEQEASIDDDLGIQKEILAFKQNNPLSIIFRVPDSLMTPAYYKGDMVGGQKVTNETKFPLFHNHFCIIEAMSGMQYLRRVLKFDRRKVTACTLNPDSSNNFPHVDEIDVYSIAQVTRHWHLSAIIRDLSQENLSENIELKSLPQHHKISSEKA